MNPVAIKAKLQAFNDAIESSIKWRIIDRLFSRFERSKLKNKAFSIIGNNCFAGGMYHKFGLQYSTPTIWTYIFPDDYIRFLENLIRNNYGFKGVPVTLSFKEK